MIKLDDIKNDYEISTMVNRANEALEAVGYTDHGPRHVGYVSSMAAYILRQLKYDERIVELAAIAGWVHDVGNLVSRFNHGASGAALLFPKLLSMGMPIDEVCTIITAVGNHEENTGKPVNNISSALIIADKIDAHRARVRKGKYDPEDVHDRVNYSINKTKLLVDADEHEICFSFMMDSSSSVMDFMSIYLSRMIMCEKAAAFLGCNFSLLVNGVPINNFAHAKIISSKETDK